jgi:UDP-glucose 4-epimerase
MILITGGLGFIGQHTARALLDLGESCVLTRHRSTTEPDLVADELGSRAFVERVDLADPDALHDLGRRHPITGIVHLAMPTPGTLPVGEDLERSLRYLLNVLRAGHVWGVSRIAVASTIAVYLQAAALGGSPGSAGGLAEDVPLPLTGAHPIEALKKCTEILATLVAGTAGYDVVNLRIGFIWGPLGRPRSHFFDTPRLVHAAVRGEPLRLDPPAYAEDSTDALYVKDCARAIALLQTADKLRHTSYNISAGRTTTNAEVIDALNAALPGAGLSLPPGHGRRPAHGRHLDLTRLREDTGYAPAYDTRTAIAEYVRWLQQGHPR